MSDIFDEIIELPDPERARQFSELVGLDEAKDQLIKQGRLLLNPELIDDWSKKHHNTVIPAVAIFHKRPPLILFFGDVGTGKTTLAVSFADPIAREERIVIRVLRLSLITRGSGAVGEMTRLITRSFQEVQDLARQSVNGRGKPTSAAVFVIDEADALAQSREFEQMHHEDRAGVNALIRGIDHLTTARLPVIIVMCTNRLGAIDPAVLRRASVQFTFERPDDKQRLCVLKAAFGNIFTDKEFENLVELTGPRDGHKYGYTYSDLTQRLIPTAVVEAFPDRSIAFEAVSSLSEKIKPTKPFSSE